MNLVAAVRILIMATVLNLAAPLAAQEQVTIKGEIVDMSCYLEHDGKGRSHRSCAQQCAKKGLPIGLLTEGGELYLLIEDHSNAEPYDTAKGLAGDKAEVKGKKISKGGVNSILVAEVKGQ